MKKLQLFLTLLLCHCLGFAQGDTTPSIGINLEHITYPFPVQYIQLNIQGEALKMAYMDVQPQQSNGKTLVLLHGKNFNGAYWEQTAKVLIGKGFRVIIPDQIGFGKSSKPISIQYSFQLLAQNTKALLDTLQLTSISLIGHSMGGMLATRFVLMYPNSVERLVLENPIGLEDWKLHVPYQSVDDWYQDELHQTYDKLRNYQLKFYYDNKWKPEYDKWLLMQTGWLNESDYPRIAFNSALLYDMIFTQPVCYEFEHIKIPTLLLIGQRDRTALGKAKASKEVQHTLGNYPALGKLAAGKMKNAQLVEMDNIGHLPHIEAFDKFIEPVLSFLKK